jgi:hypothetical protein
VQIFKNLWLNYDSNISYIVEYDIYKTKLLLLCLIAETSNHVALFGQVSGAYLNPELIGSCKLDFSTTKRNQNYCSLYVPYLTTL